jgi:ribosome-binding protein aMBF1 (putative translation factor)
VRKDSDPEIHQVEQFAGRLMRWRTERGLSVTGLAQESKVPEHLIKAIETGTIAAGEQFPMRYVFDLALALRIDPSSLFRG